MSLSLRGAGVGVEIDGARVLADVDIDVAPGSWVTVIGPNGAGKTTLLRAVAGIVGAAGTIEVGGEPVGPMPARRRSQLMALVPQDPVVPPGMNVTDYVLLGRTPHIPVFSIERPRDLEVVGEVLELLDLTGFARRRLQTLSGGERQRVVLARALAQQAPVLLLDEPTSALDIGHQQEVLDLVDRLRTMRRLTVLSTMHDLTLAGQYAERLVLLDNGRVAAEGTPAAVLTEENLRRHYRARVRVQLDADGRVAVFAVRAVPAHPEVEAEGPGAAAAGPPAHGRNR